MENKTKFAIGCLVQWYEIEMVSEYLDSLRDAINYYDGEVKVDIVFSINQDLEKCESEEKMEYCIRTMGYAVAKYGFNMTIMEHLYTIADYRRNFNDYFCDHADVLIWGESDMLIPKQAFTALDGLHQSVAIRTPKYMGTFSICKMWDASWTPLEHPAFTVNPFIENDTSNWWSLRYLMNKEEQNQHNNIEEIDLTVITPHKYNGCGLVISSEVVKAGVNIPKSVFFVHEDTAMMLMSQRLLGDIPQYHFRNILIVHNRKHPRKRCYILGEEGIDKTSTGELRKVHSWYEAANKFCEVNAYNIFNPTYTAKKWSDVLTIKSNTK